MTDPINEAIQAERARALAKPRTGAKFEFSRVAALEAIRDDMAEALAYRLGGPEPKRDEAINFVGMSFDEMTRTLLGFRGDRWATRQEMFSRAITSGDVPELLSGAGNRVLRAAYESYPGGLMRYCGRVRSRDFRPVRLIELDGDLALKPVEDGAPITEGALKTAAESFPISTFGRSFGLTRVAFWDEDLAAFANLGAQLGRFAAEFAAAKLAAVLESTAALSDGVAPFHANHANLGTGGALSETTLGELLKLMRAQTGLGGERISATPKVLVVPGALEFTARKLVWSLGPSAPLEVAVEPRLTSATAFFVLADPATVPAICYSSPDGSEVPQITIAPKPGFVGLRGKVTLDFGCGWADFRGATKNAGA